ncbi:MAG: hypothetical protein CVU50_03210 [Candidatus Cloacimonetes bacterium HGW-Cloacimonetes-3]|nr:MAG: hypothetical protein CVU50_03210 [Candidatus Cloacimonetes bacterium HGW-Cloacimonetes-3]
MLSSLQAQQSQDQYKEELLKMIADEKQLIRETAKDFLIDTLPGMMESDPVAADQALAKYGSLFNTMDQNDFIYLLGHFYARMGENTRAINSFNSLLKTKLNEDARKMLNLVLYEQMISYLQSNNREAAKDFLQVIIFENYNIDRYYPTYLYIWSEMSAEDGEFENVLTTLESYNQNRDIIMNRILPNKHTILGKVQTIDLNPFIKTPTKAEYDKVISQIDGIRIELTSVYNELIAMKGIIYLNAVVRLHKEEMGMLDGLKSTLTEYLNNDQNTDRIIAEYYEKLQIVKQFSDSYTKQITIMDVILQRQYERFLANDPTLQDKDYSDMEMKRLYDIEKNIEVYDQIISELDTSIADPQLAPYIGELKQRRGEFSEKRTDLQIRKSTYLETRKHSSDIQEQIFEAILNEYYALNADEKDLDMQIAELEDFFETDAKDIFNAQMRKDIVSRMGTQVALTADNDERNEPIRNNVRDMLSNIEFIKLQLNYRNLRARETARLAKKDVLSVAQLTELQTGILNEKRQLIIDIEAYLASHPDFQAIEQPDGNFLVNKADLYYNLAELQYAVNLNAPSIALDSYRKVVQIDPNFYYKDAALYNIGFISSQLKRNQIDSNKDRFYELNASALSLDDASRYKYSDFAEPISAYQEIVDNYKSSPYYEESLYRLGLINYYLATDADDPARFYALAVNYFDEIIANPDSKYKYDAIYQRGWLRLNTAKEADLKLAMADFLSLLNAIENKLITDPVLVQDYKDDAVKNIAYCLIAMDGMDFSSKAKGVAELQSIFAGYNNSQIISRVLDVATKNKFDLDASLQAVDFIWLKINLSPLALENPSLLDSILYIYASQSRNLRDGKDFGLARQEIYLNIIDNYGKDSDWYAANKDKNIAPQLAVIKKAYEERGKRLYIEFTENPSEEKFALYKAHMNRFGGFVELHGESLTAWQQQNEKSILILSTTLAEKTNLPINYMQAISNLHKYNETYPEDVDFFLHEGLSYTYANNIFNLLNNRYGEPGFVAVPGTPANQDDLFVMLSSNSLRFIEVMRNEKFRTPERDQEAITILLNLADIQYSREKYPEATALYLKALEQEAIIGTSSKFDIYGKLATMAHNAKNHASAEMYYRKTLAFAQTPEEKKAIKDSIIAQIQLSYEAAERDKNYVFAATERLRLADELPVGEEKFIQALRWTAHESYVKAKEYQKAIDLLLEVAGTKTDVEQVYTYYYTAWRIAEADSMMKNIDKAKSIKDSFVTKYPSSIQAYDLTISNVKTQESSGNNSDAAEAYLVLHDQAKAKTINTGDVTPDALMLSAIVNFKQAKNDTRLLEVMNQFIVLYPNHNQTIPFMEYIADDYYTKGDTLKFEQFAKAIFTKDKTQSVRYKRVADVKLYKLWSAFDIAYKNLDYASAFKYRDEYKKVEAAYIREGLTFNTKQEYAYFAAVQSEYDNIQKRVAYLRNFDNQLSSLDKSSILTASPASLISVNVNTRWQTNLVAGNRRIPNFKATVNAEVAKVSKLLDQANKSEFEIGNARRLRAQNLIARLYERGASVINTQVGYYIKTSTEAAGFRQQHQGDALTALINQVAYQQNSDLTNAEYTIHLNVYNLYQMAGYTDIYTQRSLSKLQEWKSVPDYKTDEYALNQSWVQKIEGAVSNLSLQSAKSPKGVNLGLVAIPAGKELTLSRMVTAKIAPELALLQVVYPFDIDIILNGTEITPRVVPTDTLEAGKPVTTRYAYLLPKEAWADGQNLVEIKALNTSPEAQKLYMNLQVFTDRKLLSDSIPAETVMIYSGTDWRTIQTASESGLSRSTSAVIAPNFGIDPKMIDGMENTLAKPIWIKEEAQINTVTFEADFNLDTEFKEGLIDLVAPSSASVFINGTEIAAELAMDYDSDPFQVYSSQVTIDKSHVTMGKNTIRFVVSNPTQYRGFIAAVKIVKAGKEEIR